MCGIGGVFHFSGQEVETQSLEKMNQFMQHRGPGGEGIFRDSFLGLCHRRLKIIDLDDRAQQPMESSDGRFVMTYNGECYNYREIKHQLAREGFTFRTESDTEVVLMAFAHWGKEAFTKFNGMFALAIWDRREKVLTLARDRFGIKPLYFYQDQKSFLFASEIKPLLAVGVGFSLDFSQLYDFFTLRYVPSAKTLFRGVEALKPAHWMEISGVGIQEGSYWQWEQVEPRRKLEPEHLHSLLSSAVKYRLRADVPLGSFLSGGIDSASIAELIHACGLSVDTFTFDVQGRLSEVEQAKEIASLYNHHSYQVTEFGLDNLEKVIWHLEEPIGDSILLPTYSLAYGAAKRVKVVLSGEGADEIFNGYAHHGVLYWLYRLRKLKNGAAFLGKFFPAELLNKLHPYPQNLDQSSLDKVLKSAVSFNGSMASCRDFVRLFDHAELASYLHPDRAKDLSATSYPEPHLPFLNALTKLDFDGWNNKYTLHRLDRLTMAHSLEARVPFLDHRLVEYVLSLRDSDRLGLGIQKKALRKAMTHGHLPKVLCRRKKRAFHLPFDGERRIFFQRKLEAIFDRDCLNRSELWDSKKMLGLIQKAGRRTFVEDKKLYCFLVLELWYRIFSTGRWRNGYS